MGDEPTPRTGHRLDLRTRLAVAAALPVVALALAGGGAPPPPPPPPARRLSRPAPAVSGFSPAAGIAGTAVTVKGTDLAGATEVSFGGVPGQIVSAAATR